MGEPDVDGMLRRLPAETFFEWLVFVDLEPFEEEKSDYRHGHLIATLANAHRNTKRRPTPYSLQDGILRFGDMMEVHATKPRQNWQDMKAISMAMTARSREEAERIRGRKLKRGSINR